MLRFLSLAFAAGALVASHPQANADDLVHAQLAEAWRVEHGIALDEVTEEHEPLDALIARSFVAVELGSLRLLFPPGEAGAARSVAALETLFDVQETWANWNSTGTHDAKLPKDVAKARKALSKWNKKHLQEVLVATKAGDELFANAGLDEKTAAAFDTWNAWILASSGARIADGARAEIVLLPTREQFVEFACFLGSAMPALQSVYWSSDIATWSELDYYDTRVSPLSYASPTRPWATGRSTRWTRRTSPVSDSTSLKSRRVR